MTIRSILKTSFCLICFIYLTSCSDDKPEGVYSELKMTQVLLDIYKAEGRISNLKIKRDSSILVFDVYEKSIFEKHGVNKDDYKKSMTYYYDHPIVLEKIYENILDSLNMHERMLKDFEEKERDADRDGESVNRKPLVKKKIEK